MPQSEAGKRDIEAVITTLLDRAYEENTTAYRAIQEHPAMQNAVACARKQDTTGFYYTLIHPLNQAIDGLLQEVTSSREARFLLKHQDFAEKHFRQLIEQREGRACCADKARTIIRALLRFYMSGERIQWDHSGRFTYHLPKSLFATHEQIIEFFEALLALYHGLPTQYLECLLHLTAEIRDG